MSEETVDTIRRRLALGAGATLALGGSVQLAQAQGTPAAAKPPTTPPAGYNILFVTVDQERFFESYPFPVPGRERLLREGVSFVHHENNSNVCSSSRSVIYTGLHMPQTGIFDNMGLPWTKGLSLDPKFGTLGTLLTEAGYYAAYQGKWHLSEQLDTVKRKPDGTIDLGLQPVEKDHQAMERYGFKDYRGIGDVIDWSQGGYLYDGLTVGDAVNWLRQTGQTLNRVGKPWFLAVNFVNPHDVMFIDTDDPKKPRQWDGSVNDGGISMNPAQPPDHEIYRATWNDAPLPPSRHQPFTEPGRPPAHLEYQLARAALVGQFPDEDWRWRKLQNYYFNCIRDCDTHLVRLLNELDALALGGKTIVVFTSDHGEFGGYHQMHGKGTSVYRQQMHVPFVIRHPAYARGKRCQALTCHLDIAPTLLGLTGLPEARRREILGSRRGRDISGLLAAPEAAKVSALRDASLYCYSMLLYADSKYLHEVMAIGRDHKLDTQGKAAAQAKLRIDFTKRSGIRCITDGRYKFARYFSLRQHNTPRTREELLSHNDIELFDLHADPGEMGNLALDMRANGALIDKLNTRLNELIEHEIGKDDGSYMPMSGMESWNLQFAVE
jgi:arylsulfatase A-like enzyme